MCLCVCAYCLSVLISGVPVFLPPSSLSTAATACLVILSILIAQPAASILGVYQPDFVFYTECHDDGQGGFELFLFFIIYVIKTAGTATGGVMGNSRF